MRRLIILLLITASPVGPAHANDKQSDTIHTGKVRADGAIVCRSLAMVAFLKEQLSHGVSLPDFKSAGCTLLPKGTPISIEQGIITGETMFGAKVRGVTDPKMIEMDPPQETTSP